VFNFYQPDHVPPELQDTQRVAPEFQITTASTIVGITNLLAYALFSDQSIDTPPGFARIRLDLTDLEGLATDPDALLERVDLVFLGGRLDAATRATVRAAIAPLEADPGLRVRLALYLILAAPGYAIAGEGAGHAR
jgi:hypothetical protein